MIVAVSCSLVLPSLAFAPSFPRASHVRVASSLERDPDFPTAETLPADVVRAQLAALAARDLPAVYTLFSRARRSVLEQTGRAQSSRPPAATLYRLLGSVAPSDLSGAPRPPRAEITAALTLHIESEAPAPAAAATMALSRESRSGGERDARRRRAAAADALHIHADPPARPRLRHPRRHCDRRTHATSHGSTALRDAGSYGAFNRTETGAVMTMTWRRRAATKAARVFVPAAGSTFSSQTSRPRSTYPIRSTPSRSQPSGGTGRPSRRGFASPCGGRCGGRRASRSATVDRPARAARRVAVGEQPDALQHLGARH